MALVSELLTRIKADASQFFSEMNKVESTAKKGAASVNTASVAIGTAMGSLAIKAGYALKELAETIPNLLDKVEAMGHSAEKLGTSFQSFQELAYAAKLADVPMESLSTSFGKMSSTIAKANNGSAEAAQSLAMIGLSAKELIDLSPDQQFLKIAEAIREVNNVTQQRNDVKSIFGKGGLDTMPLIISDIKKAENAYSSFNIAVTNGQLEQINKLQDTRKEFGALFSAKGLQLAGNLAGPINDMIESLKEAYKQSEALRTSISDYISKATEVFNTVAGSIGSVIKPVFNFVMSELAAVRQVMSGLLSFVSNVANKVQNIVGHGSFNDLSTAKKVDPYLTQAQSAASASNTAAGSSSGALSALSRASISMLAMSGATDIQRVAINGATNAINTLKNSAEKTAGVLDGLNQIQDAINSPGKKQATSIINQATNATNSPLADSTEFTKIFTQALKEARSGDMSSISSDIQQLQGIIDNQKRAPDLSGGGMPESFTYQNQDTSGLVAALNELKGFLAKNSLQKQQVEVKIKVDASKDFVTSVVTTQSFKDAVDAEFKNSTAEAARGDLP